MLRGSNLFVSWLPGLIQDVITDVAVDHFRHQRIQRSTAYGDRMQNIRAIGFFFESTDHDIHLSANPPSPV